MFLISGFLTCELAAKGKRVASVSKSRCIPRQAGISILNPVRSSGLYQS